MAKRLVQNGMLYGIWIPRTFSDVRSVLRHFLAAAVAERVAAADFIAWKVVRRITSPPPQGRLHDVDSESLQAEAEIGRTEIITKVTESSWAAEKYRK